MTTPRQVQRRAHTATLNAQTLEAAITAVTDHTNGSGIDGYPTTASGADTGPHGTTELTTVEAAVSRRLGDLSAHTGQRYRPGLVTDLAELDELLQGINDLLNRAHTICDRHSHHYTTTLTHLRCIGTGNADGAACTQWADKFRRDGRCVDCGRNHDAATRRQRRYRDTGDGVA